MSLSLVTLPVLQDNYVYLVHDAVSGRALLVDAPVVQPIMAELDRRGWLLTDILLTHHHGDHTAGADELAQATGARVTGAAADTHRLPKLDRQVKEGDILDFAGHAIHVIEVPGHTVGHVAYHMPSLGAAFTGDSLMSLGCGRLFEGSPAQMWASLGRLAALPHDTLICSGHEYSQNNARFALTVDPTNAALKARAEEVDDLVRDGIPTVPAALSEELATNPYLRAGRPEVKASLGMAGRPDVEVFAEIRARKDKY